MEIFLTFDKVHDHSLGLHVQKISDQATPNCQFPFPPNLAPDRKILQ